MQLQSNAHRRLILNGHLFTGYASDDRMIEYQTEDLVEIEVGQDGGHYGSTVQQYGGVITIRLQPTSPSVQWCILEREMLDEHKINGEELTTYSGTENVDSERTSWTLLGGYISQLPKRNETGQTYEAMFGFERIISNVEGGRFNPLLTTPA